MVFQHVTSVTSGSDDTSRQLAALVQVASATKGFSKLTGGRGWIDWTKGGNLCEFIISGVL